VKHDPGALAALHAVCFTNAPRPWSEQEFAEFIRDENVFLTGTEHAFALCRIALDEAELLTLCVHPDTRRAGLGIRLLEQIERMAAERGAVCVFLEVAEDNEAAQSLYARCGYTTTGLRKDYYKPPKGKRIGAICLKKHLSADPEAI
jgi:ribosomal-protein-alanine N-acetyltransferase